MLPGRTANSSSGDRLRGGGSLGGFRGVTGLGDFVRDPHPLGAFGALGHHRPGGLGTKAALTDVGERRLVRIGAGLGGALEVEVTVFHSKFLTWRADDLGTSQSASPSVVD